MVENIKKCQKMSFNMSNMSSIKQMSQKNVSKWPQNVIKCKKMPQNVEKAKKVWTSQKY